MIELLPYCQTEYQRRLVEALSEHGTPARAAASLGIDLSNACKSLKTIKKHAAKVAGPDYRNPIQTENEGANWNGDTTLYKGGPDEPWALKWIKRKPEVERAQKALSEFAESLQSDITPAKPVAKPKGRYNDDLMTAIFIGDAHVGMRAFGKETRSADFDTDINTCVLAEAIDDLVSRAPDSKTGLLVDLGDFMHANSSHNETFNGTPVDVDTRQYRTMRAAAEIMKYAITRMLEKFPEVVVVVARGNHNPDAAQAVQLIMEFFYHNEPRVRVLPSEGFFHYIEYGNWLIGVNHGDKIKSDRFPGIMARDMPQAWGRTTHRMWALGHVHHQNVREMEGCTIQTFGALPPADSWHASKGYGSKRVMQSITFRKSGGQHSSHIFHVDAPVNEPDVSI